ncbi:MAG: potassium transporter TrkG [Aphanocapsa feldmannii 277cV]|uniref:Potassium transporter TrkG n=2 Tax=Aphanocapsa feldmannii TaxID=192050 RepID=A0A524RLI8_9CHRO|nr:MAG: potassium transporter TrkG [Aphanocapsa feldmannii 277cV]TGH25759.1 MAG: potassium transporter TrkG [Aphanocapsa feldmannii 277cI]
MVHAPLIQQRQHWWHSLSVPQFTLVSGLLVIFSGSLLLSLPFAHVGPLNYWSALFTSTSAVTVTGLTVIDVGTQLSLFGQLVLMLLILIGGLGLMAITIFLQGFVLRGGDLRRRLDRGRALDEFGVGGIGPTFHQILRTALSLIAIGAILLFCLGFGAETGGLPQRLWLSLFHAVSAYNNAGFSLWSSSLEGYRANPPVNGVIILLIITGGLGYRVTSDLWSKRLQLRRFRQLSFHSRLVLRCSAVLVLLGFLGLLLTEAFGSGILSVLPWQERFWAALFQSVSARTAGFHSIPLSVHTFSDAGLVLLMALMFIGASPGGTGGGLKTTTMAVLLAATRSALWGEEQVVVHHRAVSYKVVLRALGVTVGSLLFVLLMAILLSLVSRPISDVSFIEFLFTSISAFATVGMDLGVTARLNGFGQLVLMVGMFVGRVGILLLLSAVLQRQSLHTYVRYTQAELHV